MSETEGAGDFAERVERTGGPQPWRKLLHAATGVLLALLPFAPWMSRALLLGLLAAGVVALGAFDLLRLRVPAVNRWAFGAFRSMISPREAAGPASSTWYLLSALLAYLFFPVSVASASILVLGLADPAAGLVGRRWGRVPLGKGSALGAATFFVVAAAVLVAVPWADGPGVVTALVVAAVVAGVEVLPLRLDDNLTIPLVTALALQTALAAG